MTFFITACVFIAILVNVNCGWDTSKKECVQELKLDEVLTRLVDDNIVVPEGNVDYQKFLECYWKKQNLLDEIGVINWKLVIDDLSSRFVKNVGGSLKYDGATIPTAVAVRLAIMECGRPKIEGKSNGHLAVKLQNCVGGLVKNN